MAIIEAANYQEEANELATKPEVIAAAIDLVLNEVDLDLDAHEGMMSARELLHSVGIDGSYIGAAARAIKTAKANLEKLPELPQDDVNMAQAVAVSIYVDQPEIETIPVFYSNILEILRTVEANRPTPNPLASVKCVLDYHKVVVSMES